VPQYPAQRACGRCGLPAAYRLVLVDTDENPAVMFTRRAHYRCADHFHAGLTPPALMGPARAGQYVVVDPAFTAAVAPEGLCLCGLPADHRYPTQDGVEPRGCIDETVVIAGYRPDVPPFVTRDSRDESGRS